MASRIFISNTDHGDAPMGGVVILQRSDAGVVCPSVCLLVCLSVPLGVAAALLAEDEPIKRSLKSELCGRLRD